MKENKADTFLSERYIAVEDKGNKCCIECVFKGCCFVACKLPYGFHYEERRQ